MRKTLHHQFNLYIIVTVGVVFALLIFPYHMQGHDTPVPSIYLVQSVLVCVVLLGSMFMLRSRIIEPVCQLSQTAERLAEAQESIASFPKTGISEIDNLSHKIRQIQEYVQDIHDARREAEVATQAKSDFIANISHELRTPLNAIIGFSEVLGQESYGQMNEKQKEYSEDICESGKHLLRLINDILDVSKIEAGKMELQLKPVNMNNVLMDAVEDVKHAARQQDVQVHLDVLTRLPKMQADPVRLRQILFNLMSNAVAFTSAGGHVLLQATENSDGVTVKIRDTGVGMSRDELAIAQQKFGQVESVLSRSHQGAGLGLPLAKKLTHLHGAQFSIESMKGMGTTVTLNFPKAASVVAPQPTEQERTQFQKMAATLIMI